MITDILKKISENKPLIHCIINDVASADTAQILKNIGASPVMAHSPKESFDITMQADALLINTGTLTLDKKKAIMRSLKAANKKNIPVVLDAVGYGLSGFRTKLINKIIKNFKVDIIKGNKSEISILSSKIGKLKGIETDCYDKNVIKKAVLFAFKKNSIIVITGENDIITNGQKTAIVKNGVSLMSSVIGTGCMLGAVIAAFSAVNNDFFNVSIQAVSFYGIEGEITIKILKNPAPCEFKFNFIDNFYKSDKLDVVNKKSKIEFIKK